MKIASGILLATLALIACKNSQTKTEVPARIIDPTAESRAELQGAVSETLGTDVTLADHALTNSSVLIIERTQHRDPQNNRLSGRDLGSPIQFRLVLKDRQCVLTQNSSGAEWLLRKTKCVAE